MVMGASSFVHGVKMPRNRHICLEVYDAEIQLFSVAHGAAYVGCCRCAHDAGDCFGGLIGCARDGLRNFAGNDDIHQRHLQPQAVNLLRQKYPAFDEAAACGEIGTRIGLYIYYDTAMKTAMWRMRMLAPISWLMSRVVQWK